MNFFVFLLFYIICTSISLIILYFVFTKYYADKILDNVIKKAFENNDISNDDNLINMTSLLNSMNSSNIDGSQNITDTQPPKFF